MVSAAKAMEKESSRWTAAKTVRTYPIATDCATSDYPRLIHPHETWHFLQRTFRELREEAGMPVKDSLKHPGTGIQVPFEVRDDGPRGRTLHTLVDLDKGEKVWDSSYFGSFKSEEEFTAYLQRLPHDLQCDVLLWAYPEKGHSSVGLALDEGSYMNHGENKKVTNVDLDCRALRNLKAGEEILEDYSEFIGSGEIKWFDKLRAKAWGEEKQVRVGKDDKVEHQYVSLGVPKVGAKPSEPVKRNSASKLEQLQAHKSQHYEAPEQTYPDFDSVLQSIESETQRNTITVLSAVSMLCLLVIVGRLVGCRTKGIQKRN